MAANILAELGLGCKATMDYRIVPAVLFTYPQYGMVGQTEADFKQAGKTYRRSFAKNLSWPTYKRVGLKHAAYKIGKAMNWPEIHNWVRMYNLSIYTYYRFA